MEKWVKITFLGKYYRCAFDVRFFNVEVFLYIYDIKKGFICEQINPFIINTKTKLFYYRLPLSACSLSMDSNKAWKFPFPNDFAPRL